MTRSSSTVRPVKCGTCDMLAQAPLACADCRSVSEHVQGADYFELFGLPRGYDIDAAALQRTYLAITRNVHPDAFAVAEPEMQMIAMRMSAAVNRAYQTLRDPLARASYLLETSGGKSAAEDKRVPQDLLNEVLLLREEIEDARAAGDLTALGRIKKGILERRQSALQAVAGLAAGLNGRATDTHDELRLQLNAMKYLDNLLAQL